MMTQTAVCMEVRLTIKAHRGEAFARRSQILYKPGRRKCSHHHLICKPVSFINAVCERGQ